MVETHLKQMQCQPDLLDGFIAETSLPSSSQSRYLQPFYRHCTACPERVELVGQGLVTVGAMTGEEVRKAVLGQRDFVEAASTFPGDPRSGFLRLRQAATTTRR